MNAEQFLSILKNYDKDTLLNHEIIDIEGIKTTILKEEKGISVYLNIFNELGRWDIKGEKHYDLENNDLKWSSTRWYSVEVDIRNSEGFNFRVILSEEKYYIQMCYCVTGYEEDGSYNPCIDTRWNTLSNINGYISFNSLEEILPFWNSCVNSDEILFSSSYIPKEELDSDEIICYRNDL